MSTEQFWPTIRSMAHTWVDCPVVERKGCMRLFKEVGGDLTEPYDE